MTRINITKLAMGGAGLGEIEGKKVFIPFTAPGDVVDATITRDKGSFAEARIARIIEPAACRVEPRCPVFGKCGGCQWQHLSYKTQLAWKRIILAETLERIGNLASVTVESTLPSPSPWHYRNRIQLHVDANGHVGFYRAGSHEVVEFKRCYIAERELNRQLAQCREELSRRDRGASLKIVGGPHFSQVNTAQNERVKTLVTSWTREVRHQRVIELYAGSGNFTFPLAAEAQQVISLEIDGRAVSFARTRAAKENVDNVTFHCCPADALSRIPREQSYDLVFLNPPRKGAAEALEGIVTCAPATIIYMSCNPATLARDLRVLAEAGWSPVKCQPLDMFPQTYHIEALVMMRRTR